MKKKKSVGFGISPKGAVILRERAAKRCENDRPRSDPERTVADSKPNPLSQLVKDFPGYTVIEIDKIVSAEALAELNKPDPQHFISMKDNQGKRVLIIQEELKGFDDLISKAVENLEHFEPTEDLTYLNKKT